MESKVAVTHPNAARATASTLGVLAGLGGITHGIGEILQGNTAPQGIMIYSWTQGPIAAHMGGEPAMTIVPNLFATGVLTILVSLALLVWAATLVQRKNGGWIQILLSVCMLLTGGGFAPPIMGILSGVAGLGINASYTWWRKHLSAGVRHGLAKAWPWIFGLCAIDGVFLVIGSVILVFIFSVNAPNLFVACFLLAVGTVPLAILTGIAYDVENSNPQPATKNEVGNPAVSSES
ncbi:MAG TPA: hypothetical protein VMP08_16385 [Anaerolineae bacterium]|nr:hypothetical protein [Anaerolineae bacterium]